MELRLSRESQFRSAVQLPDGTTLDIDTIRPSDEAALRGWFETLSPETRYQRFHAHVSHLSDEHWQYLTSVDGVDHIALVATIAGVPVAVARMIALPGDAELAFIVGDAHQRRGIGSALRDRLLAIARQRGIRRLHAHALPENVAIRRLLAVPALHWVSDRAHVIELVLASAR